MSQARLAQSVERKALNLVVVGSSPTVGDSSVDSTDLDCFAHDHGRCAIPLRGGSVSEAARPDLGVKTRENEGGGTPPCGRGAAPSLRSGAAPPLPAF